MKRLQPSRISQYLFLALFVVLFVQTDYRGSDTINAAVNSFFRADPLLLLSHLLAVKQWTWLLLPALLMVVATLLLGRFFCGWICPLGTLLDLVTVQITKTGPLRWLRGRLKYWLLLPMLVSSLFGLNLAGLLDPIALLLRALSFFFYPLFGFAFRQGWVELYGLLGEQRDLLAPGYGLLRDYLLPFRDAFYPLAFVSAGLLLLIIWLERYETRNWCRNLCPLGTLLGILARIAPFMRIPDRLCSDCRACQAHCPTAFQDEQVHKADCVLCMECLEFCPHQRTRFVLSSQAVHTELQWPERRLLLGGLAIGITLPAVARFKRTDQQSRFLRPPGVRNETHFMAACVRCGECMKVCLKNALYPSVLGGGLAAVYTPQLIPRLGYCEYNCTLCGQVCPTGAIPNLPLEQKKREVIGKAVFDRNHCLPFAKGVDCIVCEEHCPVADKAIRSRSVAVRRDDGTLKTVRMPWVVEERCNGCGICEHVCPLETKAGIEVFRVKDRRPLEGSSAGAVWSDPYSGG